MTQLGGFEGVEIGRGRRRAADDSSSSRESSTERSAPRRIGSPALSDDGNARMDTVADDDTPPPASRPLIRQALGFSSDQPPQSINTYEAVPAAAPKPFFLPGQEVPIPPQPKPPKAAAKPKKPRRTEKLYPGQTSRFRLGTTYDPTPSTEPPVDHGSGPYSSMYRGTPVPPRNTMPKDPATKKNASTRGKNADGRRGGSGRGGKASQGNRGKNAQNAPVAQTELAASNSNQNNSPSASDPNTPNNNDHAPPSGSYNDGPSSTTYYRDDHHHRQGSPPPESYYRDREPEKSVGDTTPSHSSNSHNDSRRSDNSSQGGTTGRPIRLLTVLIQDQRYGEVDHQLAEVKVCMRRAEPPEEGYWADSRDIARELQDGPSRIYGPARAYTLRGKYRQFILRVTPDNKDHFVSANVSVNPDKTLDLVVESIPNPGVQPAAPNISRQAIPSTYHEPVSHTPMDVDVRRDSRDLREPRESQRGPPVNDYRKRINSPSFDDYDNGPGSGSSSSYSNLNKTPRHSYSHQSPAQNNPRHTSPHYPGRSFSNPDNHNSMNSNIHSSMDTSRRRSNIPDLSQAQHKYPGPTSMSPPRPSRSRSPMARSSRTPLPDHSDDDESMSPEPDLEPQDLEKMIVEEVDNILQRDEEEWTGFYKARGGNKVADVIKEYEYIRKMCKELRGVKVPGLSQVIMDHHIAKALNIENSDDYVDRCHRTMDLYDIYHDEPRVVAMVNDRSTPKHGSNMHKRILHLLQDIDDEERNRRAQASSARPQQQQQQHHQYNPSMSSSVSARSATMSLSDSTSPPPPPPPLGQGYRMLM